jgi:hypothetical protein
VELECGPFGYVVDADGQFLVVPSFILNFGIVDDWEIVIEGRNFFLVQSDDSRRYTLRDTALSVKHVVRQGTLQQRSGPSVGIEIALLLPGIGIDPGVGASASGLLSQRWSSFALHVNGTLEITHDHRLAGAGGAILEGPGRWSVRPVAEFVLDRGQEPTVSGLVGAIWTVREKLSVDAGWRIARIGDDTQREFRAGFTWAIPLGQGSSAGSASRSPHLSGRWRS